MAIDPDLLLRGYAMGVFPMSDGRDADEVYWVEPRRRAVFPLDEFRLSRSLRKTLRSDRFTVTRDRAFAEVVRACADREDTWINTEIEESYLLLHRLGRAHSIEVWADGELAGGLYGVRLGAAFFGESMFSTARDASKIALAWLVARLKAGRFVLLDCQFMTPHLASMGALEMDQDDYLQVLGAALGGGAAGAAEFDALDRLLDELPAGGSPPGCVIAQLIGQTS
jgi:leucyl/phenylalanyl-tRNA---protein transferase